MDTLTLRGKTAKVGEVWSVMHFDENREIKDFDIHHDKVNDILMDLSHQGQTVTKEDRDEVEKDCVICDLDDGDWCYFTDLYRRVK